MRSDPLPDVTLSILIVNYNGKNFLAPCFESIYQFVTVPFEIIVVDNASSDDSVSFIKRNHPTVKLLESPVNRGFSGGNNLAAKSARGRYLLLLNNDTVICSSLTPLIKILDSENSVGALGCRLFYGDGRQQESIGYIPSVSSLVLSWTPLARLFPHSARFRRLVTSDSKLYEQPFSEVEWVSGACLLTPLILWQRLGGLDERYFMYMEDTDYCRRVQDAGYKTAYSASCEVTHFEGGGRSWVGERAVLNTINSYLVYVKKHYGTMSVIIFRILLAQVLAARSLAYFITATLSESLNGYEKSSAFRRAAMRLLSIRKQNGWRD